MSEPADYAWQTYSTDAIAAPDRLDYWRQTVLRRMAPIATEDPEPQFSAMMLRLTGADMEVVEHAADSLQIVRSARQCRQDGCDDFSIGFVLAGVSAHPEYGRALQPGAINVIDCARPVNMRLSRHRTMSFIVRRQYMHSLIGGDLNGLADLRLAPTGMASLLRSHLQSTLAQAPVLSQPERSLALQTAAQMAGFAIQTALARAIDDEQMPLGLRQAALAVIQRRCTEPDLSPRHVAAALGCSRATLYRIFDGTGESPASRIWQERLARAHHMLGSLAHQELAIGEIAFRCGFLDHAAFDRMFKRRYGVTPREMRLSARSIS